MRAAVALLLAGIGTAQAAAPDAAAQYTSDARLWGSVSREQTVGTAAITAYFARTRPGAAGIDVRFGDFALRELAPGVAVASGHYTFLRRAADGMMARSRPASAW